MKGLYLILCFLLVFAVQEINAQRSNGLAVEGTVSVEKGSVDGAVIEIFRNGRKTENYGIGSNGRYKLELNYGYDFTLNFTRKDNFPIRIAVDTSVPQNVLQSDPRFPPFPLNIKLFTEISGIDKTFSENIVLRIYYSESVDNFISELFYNDTQIKQLIDQAILQSVQIGKVADNLDGIAKAEMAELRREYDKLIKAAETEYNREEYLTALDGYKAASKIFPKEPYPHDRIAEINDLLGIMMLAQEREQALKDRLQALITQGDLQFDQKQYEDAKSSYQRALSVDAENAHSKDRITQIDEILGQAQADKEYKSLITRGDNSFDELLYAEALKFYNQALQLKKDDQYPVQKIAEINSILKQQAADAEKLKGYRESIFQAELNFEKQFYDKAISFYENALVHKPGDEVALRKIDEIKSLMNMLAAKTLYDKQIKIADRAFQRKQYAEALPAYEEAANLIPSETYPKMQVEKIQSIFAEEERLAAEAEAEKVRLAAEARAAEQARLAALEAEKERQYNMTVAGADSLFSLNQYESSRSAYQKALQIKPDEPRPQQRIEEIAQLLVQVAETQKAYDQAIAQADQALGREDFEAARTSYRQAQQVKPGESYPAERLAHIDSVVDNRTRLAAEAEAEKARLAAEAEAAEQARLAALQAETDRQYRNAVAGADSLFNLKDYEASRTAYQNALQVKPGETHPQQRIGEIGQLLVQLADARKAYDSAIALADEAFGREDFVAAKTAYNQAQQAKPGKVILQKKLQRLIL
jgi:tetratricopeptide (TPR) repeat protein